MTRLDGRDAAAIALAGGAVTAIVGGLVDLVLREPTPIATGAWRLGLGAAAVGGIALARLAQVPETVPNVLAERVGAGLLLETGGVHLAVVGPVVADEERGPALRVYLQNAFDAPRSVQVHASVEDWEERVAIAPLAVASLGPLEVGVLDLPLALRPGPAGEARIVLSVEASGAAGRRVRRFRARTATRRRSPAMRILAALAMHDLGAGGVEVRFRADDVPEGTPPPVLSPPAWRSLWRPGGTEPLAAARAAGLVR